MYCCYVIKPIHLYKYDDSVFVSSQAPILAAQCNHDVTALLRPCAFVRSVIKV